MWRDRGKGDPPWYDCDITSSATQKEAKQSYNSWNVKLRSCLPKREWEQDFIEGDDISVTRFVNAQRNEEVDIFMDTGPRGPYTVWILFTKPE